MSEVPTLYLEWAYENVRKPFLHEIVRKELERRDGVEREPLIRLYKPEKMYPEKNLGSVGYCEPDRKTKGHAKLERELTERLMADDLREDYELALHAPVPVMAEAAHRLWEKTKKGEVVVQNFAQSEEE